jgi:hypothetical protein
MDPLRITTSKPSAAYAAAGLGQRSVSMATPDTLRYTRIPLTHGSGAIPAVGFGTLIPDPAATKQATKTALEVGFRHLDCAERYRNEEAVGDAMQERIQREDVFVPRNYGTPIIRTVAAAKWRAKTICRLAATKLTFDKKEQVPDEGQSGLRTAAPERSNE